MLKSGEGMWVAIVLAVVLCAGVGQAAISLVIDSAPAPDEITVQVDSVVTIGIASDGGAYGGYIGHDDCQTGEWASPLQSLVPSGPRVDVIDADGDEQDIWWFFQVAKYNPGDPAVPAGEHFQIDFHCTAEGDCLIVLYAIDGVTLVDSLVVHQVAVTGDNPLAHWRLDEFSGDIVYDSVGNNNGTVYGATWTSGLMDGALSFDGIDDYVALPDNEPIWLPRGDFTVSMWCRFAHQATGVEVLIDLNAAASGTASNRLGCAVNRLDTGIVGFSMVTGSGNLEALYCNTPLVIDEWYHIVAVRQGTIQALYINAAVDGTRTCQPDLVDYTGNYDDNKVNLGRISRAGQTPAGYFAGMMDDVRLYEEALAQAQINELYAKGTAELAGLVSHWKLDEGVGLTAFDSVGNNDGVLEGGATWTAGVVGGALELDGIDDYVGLPDNCLDSIGSEMTISMWVQRARAGTLQDVFAYADAESDYYLFQIAIWQGDVLAYGLRDGTSANYCSYFGTHEIPLHEWCHLGLVKRIDGVDMYVNGNADTVVPAVGNVCSETTWGIPEIADRAEKAAIGSLIRASSTGYFAGRIDDVLLFDRALDSNEMYQIYADTVPNLDTFHVDGEAGDDGDDGATHESAFATIQHAIDTAKTGDTILVWPGIYDQALDFSGKNLTLRSADDPVILMAAGADVVTFACGETTDAVLKNFIITGSSLAISCNNGSCPTLENLTILGNDLGIASYEGSDPTIRSCILYDNQDGDLLGCTAEYSWVEEEQISRTTGLIAHWKFDEGTGTVATDSVANHHGVIDNAQWAAGRIGGALDFTPEDAQVVVPDSDDLTPSQAMTIACWVFKTGGSHGLVYKYASCPNESASPGNSRSYIFAMLESTQFLRFRAFSSVNESDAVDSSVALSLNQWHHVVATFDRGLARLFIDGQPDASKVLSVTSLVNDVQPLTIGSFMSYCDTDHVDGKINGLIDDVQIYDRALSTTDVQSLYLYGLDSAILPDPQFADPNNGDYHLKSTRGRYWPEHNVWVLDKVTSPCVDGGDPTRDVAAEPAPNGGQINIGAYGDTAYASLSPKPEVIISPDLNQDGIVNMFDLALLAESWLVEGSVDPPTENIPPQITVVLPSTGQQFTASSVIGFAAEASDADGEIVSVDFYVNGNLVSTDDNGSDGWTTSWSTGVSGTYNITASATDDSADLTLSSAVVISVTSGGSGGR